MKNRFWIYLFVLVVAMLALLLWQRSAQQTAMPEPTQATVPNTNASSAAMSIASSAPPPVSPPTGPQLHEGTVPTSANQSTDESRELRLQQMVAAKNVPVNFYGKVVDQGDEPISGVHVVMNVRHTEYSTSNGLFSTYPKIDTLTDAGGRFEWTSETGDELSVETIAKDGYALSPKAAHNFAASGGNFENPVIFKMWKQTGKEPLIGGSRVFGIDSGKTYTLDLINGKKIEGEADGDLRVSVTRPGEVKPRDKFEWSFSIEVIQGGLLESDDEFMYLAPDSGYKPKIEMQFDPNYPSWTGVVKKQFFIRSRNGQVYGRAQVEVDAIYNVHSAVQINYAVNPNGSQNLEP